MGMGHFLIVLDRFHLQLADVVYVPEDVDLRLGCSSSPM